MQGGVDSNSGAVRALTGGRVSPSELPPSLLERFNALLSELYSSLRPESARAPAGAPAPAPAYALGAVVSAARGEPPAAPPAGAPAADESGRQLMLLAALNALWNMLAYSFAAGKLLKREQLKSCASLLLRMLKTETSPPPSLLACACGALLNLPAYAMPSGLGGPLAKLLRPARAIGGRDYEAVCTMIAAVLPERVELHAFLAAGGVELLLEHAAALAPRATESSGGGGLTPPPSKPSARGAFVALSRALMHVLARGAQLDAPGGGVGGGQGGGRGAGGVGGGGNVGGGADGTDRLARWVAEVDADGDGVISMAEMRDVVLSKGGTLETLDRAWARLDANADGSVSLDELADAWRVRRPLLRPAQVCHASCAAH